jgi:asparaginyl-tRNA synthetase
MKQDSSKISLLAGLIGQTVKLQGWVAGIRGSGKIVFLQIRDGSGTCQCIVEAVAESAFSVARKLSLESSVELVGVVRADERAEGGVEISVAELRLIQEAEEFPIARKAHGIDFLMSHRHLWLRSRRPAAIMAVRHTVIKAIRDFFDHAGFRLVDTPILCQGAGEDTQSLFMVDYFGEPASLAQTGQLYLEAAAMAYGDVYCFGPTFRAEKSKTRRHLTEFWMVEAECAFAELPDVMAVAENMMCAVLDAVLEKNRKELTFLGRDLTVLQNIKKPFARMTYSEAVERLRSPELLSKLEAELEGDKARLEQRRNELATLQASLAGTQKPAQRERIEHQISELEDAIEDLAREVTNRPEHIKLAQSFEWGKDLGGSDETILSRQFDGPLFVTDYPKEAKAFYMKASSIDPRTVRNMDLLAPEGYGEIIGGSQREDDLAVLESKMREKGLKPEDYNWFLDLRRYGSVPHGGFGLGVERTVAWVCGLKHVRETIAFPRTMGRIYP